MPSVQNWSCHGCTDCCRHYFVVHISPAEKERIEKQHWTLADGVDPGSMMVAERDSFRLGHQEDGACVFLDASGRCRIHVKFGEEAKPLACRLYPFVLHPAGGKLVAGVRFSCPSAAANRGRPLAERAAELSMLARELVPEDFQEGAPPPIAGGPAGSWADFHRYVKHIDLSMSAKGAPVALKLQRTLHWLGAMEKGRLDQISDEGLEEVLQTMVKSSMEKVPALAKDPPAPSRFGRVFFRLIVVQHARVATVHDQKASGSGRHRWNSLRAILQFILARGRTPALRAGLKPVKFSDIEKPFGPLSAASEAALTRFFRLKIQSLHFCGRAFHDASLVEGFRSLALLYPIMVWLARWQAVSDGRHEVSEEDAMRAMTAVDYHHGYSPWLRRPASLLAYRNDIARLCGWYGR